ncbi:sialidase family protein [Streptomyces sp. KR80]|uniref:sialidase family protein n=1 Tax=Streptomyces sp. KR80 TaxID=3457426 RepID=UPI003FD25064
MQNSRVIAGGLLATVAFSGLGLGVPHEAAAANSCLTSTPFVSGTGGYHTFRIPALVRTRAAVVAFAEGRRNSAADHGDIDVVARRSSDGGCTWGPLKRVHDNKRDVAGNPAPVVDPANGAIVLLTVRQKGSVTQKEIEEGKVPPADGRRIYVQRSSNAGATWSSPREITPSVKRTHWRWYATGPGHGIALAHSHEGRLIVPANHTGPNRGSGSHVLYSDDHGTTWRIGATDYRTDGELRPDETTAAELPDGTLYFNTRDQHGTDPATRADTYSKDGGRTFTTPYRPQQLSAPVVKATLLQDEGVSCRPLLFSAPDDPSSRRHLTIRRSADGGKTWRTATVIADGPAAYSDLAKMDRTTAAVLYENGTNGPYERISFKRFTLTCPY